MIILLLAININRYDVAIGCNGIDFVIDDRISEKDHYSEVWMSRYDESEKMTYTQDKVISLNYIIFSGENSVKNADEMKRRIDTISEKDILKLLKSDDYRARIYAVYALSILGRQEKNKIYLDSLLNALNDANDDVRSASILSFGYLEWPELLSEIKKMAHSDTGEVVRKNANTMIDSFNHISSN